MCLQYHLFLASMGFVLLADDAYAFMVAWETMALSSYFLVTTQHGLPEIRRAGFLYLLIAHVGAIAILLSFGVMQGGSWQFTFDAMRTAHLTPHRAAVAFLLALIGFGAKAGLVPLHVWLPEAHPAAPSPVSALMSGVMLKTAVYGILRVTFDLLGKPDWWWGLVLLAVGLFSALYGVVFCRGADRHETVARLVLDRKPRIIFTGIGLAVVFNGVGMDSLGALALIAALYHSLNHAFMKSLLFLGTGAVLHSTGERNLGRLGWPDPSHAMGRLAHARRGARHGRASTAQRLRVGMAPAAGIPLRARSAQDFCQHDAAARRCPGCTVGRARRLRHGQVLRCHFPRPAARACPGARARCGHARAHRPRLARPRLPRVGSAANLCDRRAAQRGRAVEWCFTAERGGSLVAARAPARPRASYSAPVFFIALTAVVVLTVLAVRRFYHHRVRRAAAWDCGFGRLTPRMQDTAEGFGQPIRNIFGAFFVMKRELPSPFDREPRYRVTVDDRIWQRLYLPLERSSNASQTHSHGCSRDESQPISCTAS